jgi:hypothetical protein
MSVVRPVINWSELSHEERITGGMDSDGLVELSGNRFGYKTKITISA